jgi:uncharacterized membrane protein YozB (DUF420 family)
MLLAFAFSSVFLISYIVNHALHGDTIFPGHGPVRTLYLSILASHVILSVVALPMKYNPTQSAIAHNPFRSALRAGKNIQRPAKSAEA